MQSDPCSHASLDIGGLSIATKFHVRQYVYNKPASGILHVHIEILDPGVNAIEVFLSVTRIAVGFHVVSYKINASRWSVKAGSYMQNTD